MKSERKTESIVEGMRDAAVIAQRYATQHEGRLLVRIEVEEYGVAVRVRMHTVRGKLGRIEVVSYEALADRDRLSMAVHGCVASVMAESRKRENPRTAMLEDEA